MPNGWYALSILPLSAGAFLPLPSAAALVIGGVIAAIGVTVQLREARSRASIADRAVRLPEVDLPIESRHRP